MRTLLPALLAALTLASAAAAESLRPAEPYQLEAKDWPCEQPYRAELPLGLGWSRPELLEGDAAAGWRTDPALKRLVESVTAFDSATPRSLEAIRAYVAAELPTDPAARDAALARLYRGLLDEANFYREIVATGILQFMAQGRLAADLVAEAELSFQLAEAGEPQARAAAEQRHFWAVRAAERAQGEARFQCNRLAAVDARFLRMAAAVDSGLGG
jgi:hypothetical protein